MQLRHRFWIQWSLLIGSIFCALVWFLDSFRPDAILFPPIAYIVLGFAIGFIFLYILNWRVKWSILIEEIYEIVAYRQRTALSELTRTKHLSLLQVKDAIRTLQAQNRIMGKFESDLFIQATIDALDCGICQRPIKEINERVSCPYCGQTFHREHLKDYLLLKSSDCPRCTRRISLSEIN
jgi:hypothetical protein